MSDDLILPEYGHYSGAGPKDIAHGEDKDVLFNVQIQRQTNMTGEQIAIQVPVYKTDSYDDMIKRLDLGYHVPQIRLEHENKIMLALQEKQNKAKMDEKNRVIEAQLKAKLDTLVKKGKAKVMDDGSIVDTKGQVLAFNPKT